MCERSRLLASSLASKEMAACIKLLWPNLPPIEHRIRLLNDFLTAHTETIQNSVEAAVRCEGVSTFDYSKRYLEINLRYRSDCKDNPGAAFHIKGAGFHLISELENFPSPCGVNSVLESLRQKEEKIERQQRATTKDFAGILRVLWEMEGYTLWYSFIIRKLRGHDADKEWLPHLRRMVDGGFVLRGVGNFGRVGRIVKDGKKWRWKELPGAAGDMKSYGFEFIS